MLDNELKNKINSLWETFWTGGITNPLDVVEQMTYLMFIHDLDAADNRRAKESVMLGVPHQSIFPQELEIGGRKLAGNQLKWSVFHDFPAAQMYSVMQEGISPIGTQCEPMGLMLCMGQIIENRPADGWHP